MDIGPHSSSIDFVSQLLTFCIRREPHNVWSSVLGITMMGVLGLWQSTRLTGPISDRRVKVAFAVLVLTGLGSAGLHGVALDLSKQRCPYDLLYAGTAVLRR
jgi:hypothetical protein